MESAHTTTRRGAKEPAVDSDESRLSLFYEQKEPDEEPDESRLGLFYQQKGIKTQSEIADGAVSSFMANQTSFRKMALNDRIMVI